MRSSGPPSLALLLLIACGGPPVVRAPSRPPPVQAQPETRETETAAPITTLGEEIGVPSLADLETVLPALSQDGRIAAVATESDCCSGAMVRRGLIVRMHYQSNWVLEDIDDSGESRIDPLAAEANQLGFLAEFEGRGFRTMTSTCRDGETCELTTRNGLLAVEETEDGRLVARAGGGEVMSWHLPEIERSPECCDGGLAEVPECFIRANRWTVWVAGSMLFVRSAVESQADGCSSPPTYELLEVAWE